MKLYNLTAHKQAGLVGLDLSAHSITEVEVPPRLKPVNDPTNFGELKAIVLDAVRGIEPGSAVLVGGLGQFQALVMQLPYKFFFADFNFTEKKVQGLIPFEPFTRKEIFEVENG